jgi:hypothetical protein
MSSSPTKAYVFPVSGREADIKALTSIIEAAGCVLVCVDEKADAFERCVKAADVLVVLVCPQTIDDTHVGPVVSLANKLAKRVVGVWAADAEPNKLPPSLHKYGDATVRLRAEELAGSVCQGEAIWMTPKGEPRPKPPTPRHKGH